MKVGDLVLVKRSDSDGFVNTGIPGILIEKGKPFLDWWVMLQDGHTFEWPEYKLEVIK